MVSKQDKSTGATATVAAARDLSRRTLLKGAAAAAVVAGTGPWIVKNAFSSSGELHLMTWAGYDKMKEAFAEFEKKTGIKVVPTLLDNQDSMMAQMKAGGAQSGFDVAEPTADRVPNWVEQGAVQPLDESKINLAGVTPAFLGGSAGENAVIGGKRYGSPSIWGTEALCYNTKEVPLVYGTASYADLWKPEYAGKLVVRGHSALVGIGLMLQHQGKLPMPLTEAYKNEANMVKIFDVIMETAVKVKPNVAQFWKDENSAQGAFRTNGCVIGQNWDTTAAALMKENLPIGYLAPKEGALAWMQNFVMPKGAKNIPQAQAWISWMNTPEASAQWALIYAANPTAKGSEKLMGDATSKFLAMAYPGDALKNLWWWPVQASWYIAKRNEYQDKFLSA
jgi:spermidine/putrescine transport system substrate-binding protein